MKFLIIGTGYTAEMYSKALDFLSLEYLISSRNPKKDSIKTYEDINDINISHAFICTPIDSHHKCIEWLVRNKIKNIYCEKPYSFNERQIPIHWQNFNIKILQNRRYYDWVDAAKSICLKTGIKSIIAICPEKKSKNHKNLKEAIIGNSIHVFDLINYLTGSINKIKFKEFENDIAIFNYQSTQCRSINFTCTLDSTLNTELKFLFENGNVLRISPIEEAFLSTSMSVIEPSKDCPSRKYKPNNEDFYIKNNNNFFKAGFLELIRDIKDNRDANKLPTISEHVSLLKSIDQMLL